MKGKFSNTFEDALHFAREKDRKLQFQSSVVRMEQSQVPNVANEQPYPVPTMLLEDPHMELLQRVTNQLDNLSINLVQGARVHQPQHQNGEGMPNGPRPQRQPRRSFVCYNCGEEGHGMNYCPYPRNYEGIQARRGQQVTPPRA